MPRRVFCSASRKLPVSTVFLGCLLIVSSVFAQDEVSDCSRVHVQNPPSFVTGAAWAEGLQRFVILDYFAKATYKMDLAGKLELHSSPDPLILLENVGSRSLGITRAGEENHCQVHCWTDSQFQKRVESGLNDRVTYYFPYEQEILSEKLVFFGSRYMGDSWFVLGAGFFEVSMRDCRAGLFRQIWEYPSDYYLLGWNLMAAIDKDVYFLALQPGHYPGLYRYDSRSQSPPQMLDNLPYAEEPMPSLGQAQFEQIPSLYRKIESLRDLPVGLFARGQSLFLLSRRPSALEAGNTTWKLTKFAPGRNEVVDLGTVTLPTKAAHLITVQRPEDVAFLELDSGVEIGADKKTLKQALNSFVVVTEDWISSSLSQDSVTPPSCE